MRVKVDPDICEANGVCEGISAAVFHVNDDDTLTILTPEVAPEHEDLVREAVLRCPKAALTIED